MHKLLAAVTVLAVSTAQAEVIYVDVNCPGPGNGSEADPYCSIQTAIDNAVNTDEIVVAPGTYFEPINFLGKAITLRSSDGPDVTIVNANGMGPYGGVAITCCRVSRHISPGKRTPRTSPVRVSAISINPSMEKQSVKLCATPPDAA